MKNRRESATRNKAEASVAQSMPASPDFAAFPREQLVAVAAYYKAERRGFAPNAEISDWLEAEAEVEQMLKQLH